jgi:hypothetical protein
MNTEIKQGKRETLMGKTPPQGTMHQKKKRQLLKKCVLHSKTIAQRVKLMLSESLGEDISSLFGGSTKLQVNDPLVD